MKVTFYGHACFQVEIAGKNLLFDPFITPNEQAADIDLSSIKADYILLSHGHQDHVADAIQLAKMTGAEVISNYEIISWLQEQGVEKGHPMNHGGAVTKDGIRIKYVNAVHSSVLPDGTYGGNPGGFVVSAGNEAFYFAGDTALTMDMKLIALYEPDLKMALLPMGDNFTMGVEDAIIASDFINCHKIIGMHFDTFPIIAINQEDAVARFKAKEKELILMQIGETIEI